MLQASNPPNRETQISLVWVGLFSYVLASFHTCRPLFTGDILLSIWVGLFSYVQVSFHMGRPLFIWVGLYSYVWASFHRKSCSFNMNRSLFICVGLFSCILYSMDTQSRLCTSSHELRQLLTLHIHWVDSTWKETYTCEKRPLHIERRKFPVKRGLHIYKEGNDSTRRVTNYDTCWLCICSE